MRHARTGAVLLIVVAFCFACSQLTAKKTSIWMNSMYSAQYEEYLTWFEKDADDKWKSKDSVTEEQKEILRVKKRIFVELHPLLEAYAIYASTSASPKGFDMDLVEDRIVDLINRLVHLTLTEEKDDAGPSIGVNDPGGNSEGDNGTSPNVGPD
jgi:hypothetical protein